MQNLRFEKVSWKQFEMYCFRLANNIKKLPTDKHIDTIVAISRGGLVAARILSDLLSVHISHITISSYSDLKQKKDVIITEFPSRSFAGETILIVDEISDTGKTFHRALSYFKSLKVKKIYTLSLFLKPKSACIPDFWAKKTDAWIIFPYELKETYLAFRKMYGSGATKKLLEIGFKKKEIYEL